MYGLVKLCEKLQASFCFCFFLPPQMAPLLWNWPVFKSQCLLTTGPPWSGPIRFWSIYSHAPFFAHSALTTASPSCFSDTRQTLGLHTKGLPRHLLLFNLFQVSVPASPSHRDWDSLITVSSLVHMLWTSFPENPFLSVSIICSQTVTDLRLEVGTVND